MTLQVSSTSRVKWEAYSHEKKPDPRKVASPILWFTAVPALKLHESSSAQLTDNEAMCETKWLQPVGQGMISASQLRDDCTENTTDQSRRVMSKVK
jgi:hypothetical protein